MTAELGTALGSRDPHRSRSRSSLSRLGGRRRRDPPRVVAAHRRGPRPYLLAAASGWRSLSRAPHAGEATALVDEASAIYEGSTPLTTSTACSRCFVQCAFAGRPRRRPSFGWDSLAERAEGRRPHRRRAHEPGDRRAAVRLPPHGRDPRRARAAKLGHANRVELAAEAARRSVIREAIPTAPTAPAGDRASPRRRPRAPRRLTQPAGGSSTSSRIVISTRRSCPHGSQPASVT